MSTAPLAFTGATVYVTPTRTTPGDVWTRGGVITHAGPARLESPGDARTIDASGASIVPLLVGGAVDAHPAQDAYALAPGNPATFAVTRGRPSASQISGTLIIRPDDLLAVVAEGEIIAWNGRPATDVAVTEPDAWVGTWIDRSQAIEQHLLPEGRYTETRGGRADAYTGAYWTRGDRITYLDDTGFWAFGVLLDDVLHHAAFVMTR